MIMLKKNVFILEGARCCVSHMLEGQLTTDAIDRIRPLSVQQKQFSSTDISVMINQWQILFQRQKRLDFDDYRSLTDEKCQIFTSLSKNQFNDLASQLSESTFRNSSNRSVRTALAILLMKLRLGLSDKVLAALFHFPSIRSVSRALESTRNGLINQFVPTNIGFNHITRDEVIRRNTSTIAQRLMCRDEPDTAIVVIDGTYVYIQVS